MKMTSLKSNLIISYSSSIIGLVITLIIARVLGAEEYKWIALGLAIGNVLLHLVEMGSQRIFVRDAIKKTHEFEVTLLAVNSLGVRLTSFVFCIFIIILFSVFATDSRIAFFGLVFASMWVLSIGLYPASWYDYTHNTKKQNIFIFVERLLTLAVCMVFLFLPGYLQITLTIAFPIFIVRILLIVKQVSYWINERDISYKTKIQLIKPTKKIDGISYFVTMAMISNAILTYGNQVVLGLSSHKMQLPSYSIALQIVGLIMIFQGQALRIMLRDISEICDYGLYVKKNIFKQSIFLVIISTLMVIMILGATRYILPYILNDEKFPDIHQFVLILGAWVIVSAIGKVIAMYMLSFSLDKYYMRVSILGGTIAFILGLIFIPVYGSYAVAFILIGTHVLIIVSNYINLNSYIKRNNIH